MGEGLGEGERVVFRLQMVRGVGVRGGEMGVELVMWRVDGMEEGQGDGEGDAGLREGDG